MAENISEGKGTTKNEGKSDIKSRIFVKKNFPVAGAIAGASIVVAAFWITFAILAARSEEGIWFITELLPIFMLFLIAPLVFAGFFYEKMQQKPRGILRICLAPVFMVGTCLLFLRFPISSAVAWIVSGSLMPVFVFTLVIPGIHTIKTNGDLPGIVVFMLIVGVIASILIPLITLIDAGVSHRPFEVAFAADGWMIVLYSPLGALIAIGIFALAFWLRDVIK